ncbi:hypothetical protein [Mesorhizobium sp. Z1-4]|uniref:hypothetical protein n=1 Tax=Mesorhizobium sp. Z1-4 TaxID=2448478 RepID=UPI000FDB2BF8|nr:hypothetical protein [Mesorhizobium sp. Z1-4]
MAEFTPRQKAECADREVAQRQKVYGRRVLEGRMTRQFADQQIAMMSEIAREYRAMADAEEAKGRLL